MDTVEKLRRALIGAAAADFVMKHPQQNQRLTKASVWPNRPRKVPASLGASFSTVFMIYASQITEGRIELVVSGRVRHVTTAIDHTKRLNPSVSINDQQISGA